MASILPSPSASKQSFLGTGTGSGAGASAFFRLQSDLSAGSTSAATRLIIPESCTITKIQATNPSAALSGTIAYDVYVLLDGVRTLATVTLPLSNPQGNVITAEVSVAVPAGSEVNIELDHISSGGGAVIAWGVLVEY